MELKKVHQKAIVLLFEGDKKRSEIASELQIAESTLYNWLKDDTFTTAYAVESINGKGKARVKSFKGGL